MRAGARGSCSANQILQQVGLGERCEGADWSLSAADVVELASAGCDDPVELFLEGPSALVLGCTRSTQ
jgi:hypothetical protein